MSFLDKREQRPDRRSVSRGGRRPSDRPGQYPPVLVADSFDGVRDPCARYLSHFRFEVMEATDGDEAMARIATAAPHVILTDYALPTLPIGRLTELLSQDPRTRQIPVVVMAGDIDPDTPHPFDDHVAGILVKPFSLRRMLEEIRRVLRSKRS